jgi:hypothetical protein
MPEGCIRVGEVEVVGLSDALVDYPWSLEELFFGSSCLCLG